MKLTCRQDVEAPADFVFARLADVDGWERAALRRGAEVTRTAEGAADGQGAAWSVAFTWRGKLRRADLKVTTVAPPAQLVIAGLGPNLEGRLGLEVIEMAPKRSRIMVRLEIRPRTLVARIFVQSLKLTRAREETRLRNRAAQLAADVETRYRESSAA